MNTLLAISPIDGRYANKTTELQEIFSEYALIKNRLIVEIEYFKALAANSKITDLNPLSNRQIEFIDAIVANFDIKQCQQIKDIEKTTNHDVKALEYYIKQQFTNCAGLANTIEFVHFACTSEDINNLAHGLMLKQGIAELNNHFATVQRELRLLITDTAAIAMLGKTHGQPATPTTVGKELANFYVRLKQAHKQIINIDIKGKLNGAIGNFNPHTVAYPEIDWATFAENFVTALGLSYNSHTTQIEPHDYIAQICTNISNLCNIIIDLDRDIWSYISIGYFKQKVVKGEIGSSTMPHKVNPIDFENSEGNARLASAIALHLSQVLPISRLQRDLTDSTTLRNLGVTFAYLQISLKSLIKGLKKLKVDELAINSDLNNAWQLLAEPIQTIMRKNNIANPYEKLKELTRGKAINQQQIAEFINSLEINADDKQKLIKLTPSNYLGIAERLALEALNDNG